ncbi:MAG: polysaccharide biosynthesis protein [Bryobacterales bacterium]|nr:polysaccharide biosynthesis protein [Bryobacterales bacterium]
MANHLTQRSFSALGWGYAGFLTRSAAGFLGGLVMARLLGPKPFGQVAAASLVIGIANLLADGGCSSAIVQAPELSQRDVRFAFTLQVTIGTVLTLACLLAAPSIAEAFHDPMIANVLRLSAFLFVIQAFGLVPTAMLKREMAFQRIQYVQIASYLLGYAFVGITAALRGWGVWSLIAAQLVQSASYAVLVFAEAPHSIIPNFSKSSLHLARFGMKVTGANLLNWCLSNFDNAVVGRAFGSGVLGLYSRAFNTVSTPAESIVNTWQQVLFASCSRAGKNSASLRSAYLASLSAVTLMVLPVFWSVAVCAPVVVAALYGSRWLGLTPLLAPLALAITLHAAMAISGPVLSAMDQVRYEIRAQLISLIVAVAAFFIAAQYSAVAVAWTVLGVYGVRFVAASSPLLRLLDVSWMQVLRATRGSMIFAGLISATVWAAERVATERGITAPATLMILLLVGGITTIFLLLLAADHIVAPELIAQLGRVLPSLPRVFARRVEKIISDQRIRAALREVLSDSTGPVNGRTRLFIATMMAPRGDTGVQTHFAELRRELERQGIGTEVITPFGAPRALRVAAGAMRRLVALLPGRAAATYAEIHLDQFLLWRSLRRRLPGGEKSWTVYAQCPRSAIAAMRLRRRESQVVVTMVHFNRSQGQEMVDRGLIRAGGALDRQARRIERQALLGSDRVVFCSAFMQSVLSSSISGLNLRPQRVIPSFVPPPVAQGAGLRGDIITIGTFEPQKNQQAILRMVAEAGRRGQVYTLTIVGSGELDDDLRALASQLGIAQQVTFPGDIENASSLLHRHRIYVHAAKTENLPLVLIEAFAAGLPVLAPAVGGIPEVLTHGAEGLFWNTDDVETGAVRLISVLNDERARLRMGEAARATYNARFRSDCIAQQLYSFVIGEPAVFVSTVPALGPAEAETPPLAALAVSSGRPQPKVNECL